MDISGFYQHLPPLCPAKRLKHWLEEQLIVLKTFPVIERWGEAQLWLNALDALKKLGLQASPNDIQLDSNAIRIGTHHFLTATEQTTLKHPLMQLAPWRKGPFNLFGLTIDTEWQSHLKWQRVSDAFENLDGEFILDVGAGNGYYGWRMLGAGAKLVLGLDPTYKYVMQWQAIQQFCSPPPPNFVLPYGIEAVPDQLQCFDRVFSMGVLYHRKSPIEHLLQLKNCLKPGGTLVLETLIINGKPNEVLLPESRYAKMRNVWFIPTVDGLIGWLRRIGFQAITVINENITSTEEQRSTEWMASESLQDFLNADQSLTIEGYPRPRRVILTAKQKTNPIH